MQGLLFLLLFDFALTSVFSDQLPFINITITRSQNDVLQSEIPRNCCVINFPHAFELKVYMPKRIKKEIECFDAHNRKKKIISSVNLREHSEGYYYTIQKATAFMATEWQCKLFSKSELFTRSFKVHVRGQGLVRFYINNNIVSNLIESTTLDYDKYAIYHYIDEEMTPFKCSAYKNSSSPQILYRNQGEQLEVVGNKEAVLYLKLTKEHCGTYIDCKVTKKLDDGLISSIFRVYFRIKTTLDIPRFKINEMVLTPVSQSSPEYNPNNPTGTFVYNYYNHENVIIRTLTGNSSSLSCSIDKTPSQTVKEINLNTTLTKHNNNMKLTCTVKDNQHQKNVTMTLNLKYVTSSDFYPMSGLSWANVLAKYKKNDEAVVIKYSYRVNGLLLTCSAKDTGNIWEFDTSQIRSENVTHGQEEISGKFRETKWFELKSNYSRTTIKCYENYGQSAEVELIRDDTGPLQFLNILETDIMDYFNATEINKDISSAAPNTRRDTESGNKINDSVTVASTSAPNYSILTTIKSDDAKNEENTDGELSKILKRLLIYGLVTVAIIVIAITGCLIVKRFRQKRKEQANSSNINYENLPEHNGGPMPIPKQWQSEDDDATYCTPDVGKSNNNLYAEPLPKALRPAKTPIYAEAFDRTDRSGADYVNTGRFVKKTAKEENENRTYSEVYQSNKEVNSNSNLNYANIDRINEMYAQIEPKTMRDCDNIVSLKEHLYGNMNETDNKLPNHYSEPAYAEMKQ